MCALPLGHTRNKWPIRPGRKKSHFFQHFDDFRRQEIGTDGGSIVQLESGNFSGVLSCSPSDGIAIRAMSVYSGGFICGCDNGIVRLFELSEDDGQYSLSKSMKIHDHENARVCTVAISPTEDMAVFTLSDNQMFTLKLDNLEMLKETDMNFTPTLCAFHGPAPAAWRRRVTSRQRSCQ